MHAFYSLDSSKLNDKAEMLNSRAHSKNRRNLGKTCPTGMNKNADLKALLNIALLTLFGAFLAGQSDRLRAR